MRALTTTALGLALVAAGVTGPAPAQETAASAAPAGLTVEQAVLDLGTITSGEDAVGVYVFHNPSHRDIKIISAKPS